MKHEREKAILLANNIYAFLRLLDKKNLMVGNADKLYQVKLLVKEYQFRSIADELKRVNSYSWDGRYTHLLVGRLLNGLSVVDEYVRRNKDDLFLLSGRLYSIKSLCASFNELENLPTIH